MAQLFLNNFETTFIAPVKDAPTTGTPETELDYGILRISDGAAGALINPSNGDYYVLTAFKRSGTVESGIEVMRVTAVDNSIPGECRITVLRGQEGTTPKAYVSGDRLALRLTAGAAASWVQDSDPRLTDARTPTGAAGGVLSGAYPNPGFAVDMATQAELDAVAAAKQDTLVSGTNIKTVNGNSLLGSGDVAVEPPITAGTTTQYWRGDKTWQTLDKAAVGLANVDNTADSVKNVLSATKLTTARTLTIGNTGKSFDGSAAVSWSLAEIGVQGGGGPTLQGDTAPYVTQTKTYTITNYNSFSSYAVSASAGTASISGDTITFTAPGTPGSVSLTLTVDGQPTAFTITVQAAGVAKPTNTSPADGAVNIGASPTLQSSAFVAYGLADTHLASRWTLYQGGTQVHSSGWRTDALTSYSVPAGVTSVSTAYTWTVEHRGTTLGDSVPSVATSFTTAASFNSYIPTPAPTPANFGEPLEGGFYAGMIWNQIAQSSSSKTLATGTQTFTVPDMTNAPIVYGGQMVEVRSRANPANKFVGTVTGAQGTSLTINVTSIDGSGTFSDWSVMARHRLIVAPKASGEHAGIALKNTNSALPTACQTLAEGFAATQAMRDADTSVVYPAAHWARSLNIGGRTDWYIPARDELELCWRNLKPVTSNNYVTADRPTTASFSYADNGSYGDTARTHGLNNNSAPAGVAYTASVPSRTAATAFRSGGAEAFEFGSVYYWSCSDYNASDAWYQNWNSSYPGYQHSYSKTNASRVRAVRRSII